MMIETTRTYDFLSPAVRANPQAIYAQMRRETPAYRHVWDDSKLPLWILTRYDDVLAVLKDQRLGKNIYRNLPRDVAERYHPELNPEDPWAAISLNMLDQDPPEHTRLRALVHKAFTPRMVEDLRPRIQEIADSLLDEMGEHGETDLLAAFAFPLPVTVIAEMLGIPAADRDQFRKWTKILLFSADFSANQAALMEFGLYMNNMIHERREKPQKDIISTLVQAEEDGDTLNHMELLSMLFLLLVAGHETTVNLIGNGTLTLLQHRDQLEQLRSDPALIRPAAEEMLRYNGPVDMATTRWAFEDIELSDGSVIPKGEPVWPSLLAANRDPDHFADPDRFDIRREPNKHIAFGNGIHYCVGAPLARLEGTIALNALVQRLPQLDLAVAVEDLEWSDMPILHGMKTLPVRY
jgi:cytochrome P450 PksS